jgi:hypothetical protein
MMGSYGVFVLGATAWHLAAGTVPKAETMGIIGFLVLMAHGFVAVLLFLSQWRLKHAFRVVVHP